MISLIFEVSPNYLTIRNTQSINKKVKQKRGKRMELLYQRAQRVIVSHSFHAEVAALFGLVEFLSSFLHSIGPFNSKN